MSQRQFDNLQLIARTAFIRTIQIIFLLDGKPICYRIQHQVIFFVVRFCVLETKFPNLVYLNFQLSVQEPREHFVSQITELLFLFRRYFSHSLYVTHVLCTEFTSCVSNFRLLRNRFWNRFDNSAKSFPDSVFARESLLQEVVFPRDQSFPWQPQKLSLVQK